MPSAAVKYGLAFVACSIATDLAYHIYNTWAHNRNRNKIQIQFVNLSSSCCLVTSRPDCCNPNCSARITERIIGYIAAAKSSIRIAMYVLTYEPFKNAVINAKRRGVNVKVLVDERLITGNLLVGLEKEVPVRFFERLKKTPGLDTNYIMHHKLCMIDVDEVRKSDQSGIPSNGIFIGGSLNWTSNALTKNCENVIFTSRQKIIDAFKKEFDTLWNDSRRSRSEVGY